MRLLYASQSSFGGIKIVLSTGASLVVYVSIIGSSKAAYTYHGSDPENSDFFVYFSHQRSSKSAVRTSLEKQLDVGSIASRGGSVPVFLRKHTCITTCDLPGGGGGGPDMLAGSAEPLLVAFEIRNKIT